MRPASWPIAVRIAIAGIAGTFAPVLVISARAATFLVWQTMHGDSRGWATTPLPTVADMVLGSLGLTALVLLFTSPLIAIAVATGLIFRRSIARHLLAWSLASPFAVWLFVCLVDVARGRNNAVDAYNLSERLWISALSTDHLLYLVGAFVSGRAFYALSVLGVGRAG